MRLPDIAEKIKQIPDLPKDIFILLIIVLVAFGAYLGGRYATWEKTRSDELRIMNNGGLVSQIQPSSTSNVAVNSINGDTASRGMYVGSKSGKTYHLPWCSGAKRIKEANKIWFQSKQEAELRGYKPSVNCDGI